MKHQRAIKRLDRTQVHCVYCMRFKQDIVIADYLVPVRTSPYELAQDGFNIRKEVFGVCEKHMEELNDFQRKNRQDVDPKHKHLVYNILIKR